MPQIKLLSNNFDLKAQSPILQAPRCLNLTPVRGQLPLPRSSGVSAHQCPQYSHCALKRSNVLGQECVLYVKCHASKPHTHSHTPAGPDRVDAAWRWCPGGFPSSCPGGMLFHQVVPLAQPSPWLQAAAFSPTERSGWVPRHGPLCAECLLRFQGLGLLINP